MSQLSDPTRTPTPPDTDLAAAVHRVLAASTEPLTVSKIRSRLPSPYRNATLEELADYLHRQVTANVLYQYPKYRSQQDRFWDRPMPVHIALLLRATLEEEPLAWSELRRKLPAYALSQAELVLLEEVAQGRLHRHPRRGKRGGDRFGLQPADAKDYLKAELASLLRRLERLGFSQTQLRAAALELLHDEEWSSGGEPAREVRTSGTKPAAAPELPTEGTERALSQAETHPESPDALSD